MACSRNTKALGFCLLQVKHSREILRVPNKIRRNKLLNVIDKTVKMLYVKNKNFINQFKSATCCLWRNTWILVVCISSKLSKNL